MGSFEEQFGKPKLSEGLKNPESKQETQPITESPQEPPENLNESAKSPEKNQEKTENQEKNLKLEEIKHEVENIGDRLGRPIDEGIRETVVMFKANELPTSDSCEGHVDRGLPVPYVEVSAPNEPQKRFIGQNEAFEKAAKKYNITLEEAKTSKIDEAYWEAMKECSQNEETEEYKKWNKENEKLLVKGRDLLEEFYKNRKVEPNVKLQIEEGVGNFRIHNGGEDYQPIIETKQEFSEEEKKMRAEKLEKYRPEMKEFTEFLKEKYFERNSDIKTANNLEEVRKLHEQQDQQKLQKLRKQLRISTEEEIMTQEQRTASEIRERYKYQERDPFEYFMADIEQDAERRAPTPEERERIDSNLIQLGKIFEGSNVRWHIDGALNISLMRGEYIGIHKDVDISIEQDELEKVDGQLNRNGYGLFLSYPKKPEEPEGKKIMERVGAKKFSEAELENLMIAAIDKQGKIREGEMLNFIDVHLVKRNKSGRPVSLSEVELPNKWFEAQPIQFQGQEIHLSHPAKIAYFKLDSSRAYDHTDLRVLAETGKLTLDDLAEIEHISEQEAAIRKKNAEEILEKVSDKIRPEMTADQIFDVFANEPAIVGHIEEQIRGPLKILAQKIEAGDKSKSEVIRLAFETFNMGGRSEERRKEIIEELRRWISDAKIKKDSR